MPIVEPFTPSTPPAQLEDLRARLLATRWPDAPEDAGWTLGTDLGHLRELVAYWADGFDWPAQEAALAALPQVRVGLDGLMIHAVHARAVAPAGPVLLLVLTHGWPDSFWRYVKVIPLLTDPAGHGGDPADASTSSSRACRGTATPTVRPARPSTRARSPGCGRGS